MSQQSTTFDASVAQAADCYVVAYGLEEAIAKLQARRGPNADPKVDEALAYLKQEAVEDDG